MLNPLWLEVVRSMRPASARSAPNATPRRPDLVSSAICDTRVVLRLFLCAVCSENGSKD